MSQEDNFMFGHSSNSDKINMNKFGHSSRMDPLLVNYDNEESINTANTSTDIDDDSIFEDTLKGNELLRKQWESMKMQINTLKSDNERFSQQLLEEKDRNNKYQSKLKFIQENQAIFEKLKNVYLCLKYNESATRPLVQVQEKSCQSTCAAGGSEQISMTDSSSLNMNLDEEESESNIDSNNEPVQRKDFEAIKETVLMLKNLLITQPLQSFVMSERRETKYKRDICDLFADNQHLRQLLIDQRLELDVVKQQLEIKRPRRETNLLKKIIAKLDKQIRACNVCVDNVSPTSSATNINDRERRIIEHISAKYDLKLNRRSEVETEDNIPNIPKQPTPYYTPRTPNVADTDTYRTCDDIDSVNSLQ